MRNYTGEQLATRFIRLDRLEKAAAAKKDTKRAANYFDRKWIVFDMAAADMQLFDVFKVIVKKHAIIYNTQGAG